MNQCGQHKPCVSLWNEPVFIVNRNIFSWTFVILYCFQGWGHVSAGICLASTYHQMNLHCFLGKYCLIRQSLAFKHCFFPTSHDPVRIEQRQFFFHLQPTSCLKHLNRHSTLTVLLGRTPMRLNNCELWWVLCLKISFWIMSHGFLECGCAMNAELKDCGQWAAACQYYCMPLQSSNKRKALDAIH